MNNNENATGTCRFCQTSVLPVAGNIDSMVAYMNSECGDCADKMSTI